MENKDNSLVARLFGSSVSCMRRCLFRALSVGPVPSHVAFILDGNRRYAKRLNMEDKLGYSAGFLTLMTLLKYCYELGIKYITIYVFSIENFKRKPEEVQSVMDLMLEKIQGMLKEESIVNQYGVRVKFVGNLKLLSDPVRIAAEKAMNATATNDKVVLVVAVAYTSTDEIAHASGESCLEKVMKVQNGANHKDLVEMGEVEGKVYMNGDDEKKSSNLDGKHVIKLGDVERSMYMAIAPDPDILIRSSGETRLSNFMLWQTSSTLLYSPKALWPEIRLRHLVWAVLNFQRDHTYLERRRKQL